MPQNNKNLENKVNDLEARNSKLEADLSILASRPLLLNPHSYQSDDGIELKVLWNVIWSGKWLIAAITSCFAVASVLYVLSLPNEYKSTVLLAPASSSSSSALSKIGGQFGGLATLAGISLGSGGAEDKSVVAMEIIKTWGFLEAFINDNNIQVEVFAANGWNRENDELLIDSELYDIENRKWVRKAIANKRQKAEPSSWELFVRIKDKIMISQDKETGLILLSVEFYSPKISKDWTDKLVESINAHIQKKDREEALKSIEYLKKKIKETDVADMQSVFYQLIEEQTKTLMLAEISQEYVFKTLSPAKVAERKSNPKRAMIVILTVMISGFLSLVVLFVRHFSVKNEKDLQR